MKRVDRYIIVEFARVFCICFVTFLGIFVVADFVNHFDELVRHAKTHGGMGQVLGEYYGAKVPWFFDFIGRIIGLVAAVFAVTSLQRNNEMAAMMAAGISRWRIVKPLVISVGLVAVLGVLNREVLIPRLGERIFADARNLAGDKGEEIHPQYDHATGIFIEGESIVPADKAIIKPTFHMPNELAPRGTVIVAEEARQAPREGGRPAGFLLTGVDQEKTGVKQTVMKNDALIVAHPSDVDWLKSGQLFVVTDLPFDQLRGSSNWKQCVSTLRLISVARNDSLDSGADVSVAIHSRILQPFVDMLLLFLGLPIVLSRESRNAFIAVGSCMLVVSIFIVSVLGLQSLGSSYVIAPSLAAWLPVLIFVPIAFLMSGPLHR